MGTERQEGTTLAQIKPDHLARYVHARKALDAMGEELRVLDLGCGIGYGSFVIAAERGHWVTGLDQSREAIESAREHYATERALFSHAAARELHNSGAVFDVCVAFEFLEHIDNPAHTLRQINANVLFASVPNEAMLPWSAEAFPHHRRHYTRPDLERMLNDGRWTVTHWYSQYNKSPGIVYPEADDGRTLIVRCERKVA